MYIVNNLIINFTKLVNEQSNIYSLKIGNKTFELLLDFIHNELEPPLLLIKNKYNQIEENLLSEILKIIDTFPNYYLIVKNKLNLGTIIKNISSFYDEAKEILLKYTDDLYTDLSSYTFKLIHYTFISGLYSYDKECNDPICLINFNKINNYNKINRKQRRLSSKINNIKNKIKNITNMLSNQQKRNLDGYNSKMGAITENDICEYIFEIRDNLYNFNNSLLNEDYKNMKNTLNKFLIKNSNLYLIKLKQNINIIASKFSTILTKNVYNQLDNKLFKQYFEIESYINNYSNILEKRINKFSSLLNYSSKLIEKNYYTLYRKVNGYFQLFSNLIHEKLKYISYNDLKSYNHRILNEDYISSEIKDRSFYYTKRMNNYFDNEYNSTIKDWNRNVYEENKKYEEQYNSEENGNENKTNLDGNYQGDNTNNKEDFDIEDQQTESLDTNIEFEEEELDFNLDYDDTSIKSINYCIFLNNYKHSFANIPSIKIIPGLNLGFSIAPIINAKICIGIGPFINNNNNGDNSFYMDIFGDAELSMDFSLGFYKPSKFSRIYLYYNFGIKGILGSGKIGMRLNLYFTGEKKTMFSIKIYHQIEEFKFVFFIYYHYNIFSLFRSVRIKISIFEKKMDSSLLYYYSKTIYYLYEKLKEIKELCIEEINTRKFSIETKTINKCYN